MAGSGFWDTVSKSEKRGTDIVQWYKMLANIHRALGSIPYIAKNNKIMLAGKMLSE